MKVKVNYYIEDVELESFINSIGYENVLNILVDRYKNVSTYYTVIYQQPNEE